MTDDDDDFSLTAEDRAALFDALPPAEAFSVWFGDATAIHDTAPAAPAEPAQNVPLPNLAQGSSGLGSPLPLSPSQQWSEFLLDHLEGKPRRFS